MEVGLHGLKDLIRFCAAASPFVWLPITIANFLTPTTPSIAKGVSWDDMLPLDTGCPFFLFPGHQSARAGFYLLVFVKLAVAVKSPPVVAVEFGQNLFG